ncbi:MAG: YbaB/EbfC family nucleoid-associated protein [Sphaerochaetaceae bacterium]|nr:YbaB/EbfC family nucleoid-associated protein [Sphaerochaetaceae bacterium]
MINPLEMMKNLESLREKAEEVKKKAATTRATGYAMGNMIEVVVTGEFKVESVKIDPSLLTQDVAMLEVLLASATNNALDNVKALMSQDLGNQFGL